MGLDRQPARQVSRLKSLLMGHTLPEVFGCAHNGYALVCAGNAWADRHVLMGASDRLYQNWRGCLGGTKIREEARISLCSEFPFLTEVYNNSLWSVLRRVVSNKSTDELVSHYRLNERRVGGFSNRLMAQLCGVPSWQRLGVLIAILFSSSLSLQLHRVWVQKNLALYFEIACLRPPLSPIWPEFHGFLNSLFECHPNKSIDKWPLSDYSLGQTIEVLVYILSLMDWQGWTKESEGSEKGYELLWQLMDKRNSEVLTMLMVDSVQGRRMQCPSALRMSVMRARQLHQRSALVYRC